MKIGQCITSETVPLEANLVGLLGEKAIVVEMTATNAVVAVKLNGTWIFQTIPAVPDETSKRGRTRPNCFACSDAGVLLTSRTGSDNTDVSIHVDPCDSCTAYKGVDADIFGSYYDSLPRPVEDELARLGIEP